MNDESNLQVLLEQAQRVIDLILRYVLAGGTALLVFGYLQGNNFAFLRVGQSGEISAYLTTLVIIVCGVAVYTVHRALLYRPILKVLMRRLISHRGLQLSDKTVNDTKLDANKLDDVLTANRLRRRTNPAEKSLQEYFDTWASEVHLLYSSFWGILFATVVALTDGYRIRLPLGISIVALLLLSSGRHSGMIAP